MEQDYGGSHSNEANPLYIVDSGYFPPTVRANLTVLKGPAEGITFAGMADKEGQGEHNGIMQNFNYEEHNTGMTCTDVGLILMLAQFMRSGDLRGRTGTLSLTHTV